MMWALICYAFVLTSEGITAWSYFEQVFERKGSVVVKKSRHEKYLFLICFFKSRHEEYFCRSCFFKSGHGQ